MREEPLISVIVPVYNVETFLLRCLESITSQTYHNLEIILVDDGSTDSSGEICDSFVKTESRASVIHQENGGLWYARNTGQKEAKGDFIMFVEMPLEFYMKRLFSIRHADYPCAIINGLLL